MDHECGRLDSGQREATVAVQNSNNNNLSNGHCGNFMAMEKSLNASRCTETTEIAIERIQSATIWKFSFDSSWRLFVVEVCLYDCGRGGVVLLHLI